MDDKSNRLLDYIKGQTSCFLKEMDDFYPFGVAINSKGDLIPLAAYLNEKELSVQPLLNILENHINENLLSGKVDQAAIALSVIVNLEGSRLDAVQMRLYKPNMPVETSSYIYTKTSKGIEFQ